MMGLARAFRLSILRDNPAGAGRAVTTRWPPRIQRRAQTGRSIPKPKKEPGQPRLGQKFSLAIHAY